MPRTFQHSLAEVHAAERAWVDELKGWGLSVAHGSKVVTKEFDPKRDHLQHPDAAGAFRIEIKNRGITFTSKDDYPYPTVFLCNLANAHRDLTQPWIYVLRSEPTGRWLWVCATDRDETWTSGFRRDTTRNSNVHILECPKKFLREPDELRRLLLHHEVLDLLDGGAEAFAAVDRCSPKGDRKAAKGERRTQEEGDQCLGRDLKQSKKKSAPCGKRSKPSGQ